MLLFLLGQWLAALVFLGNRQGRVQCGDCSFIFQQPPLPRAPVAKFAGWILLLVGLGAVAMLLGATEAIDSTMLPESGIMLIIEGVVSNHLRLFTYVTSITFVVIVVSCVGASSFSNARHRRDYADRLYPEVLPVEPPSNSEPMHSKNGSEREREGEDVGTTKRSD